jgi:transposase
MTAQIAIITMSNKRCSHFPASRGSGRSLKYACKLAVSIIFVLVCAFPSPYFPFILSHALALGIDIAKRSHTAVVLNTKGEVVVKALAFDNNRAGIEQLLMCLAGFELPVEIALESTGHYWLAVYEQLAEAGYRVHVLNPIQIRNFSRSGIRKRKNDRLDAQWIAEYLRVYEGQLDEMYFNTHLQLRRLSRFRLNLSDQIGDAKRRIVVLLDIVFPEYEQFFSDTFIQSSRQMLAKALAPQEFAEFDLTELAQLLRRASHGYYGEAKAREIQEIAQQIERPSHPFCVPAQT